MTTKAWKAATTRVALGTTLALLAAVALPLTAADHWLPNCPHNSPHSHTYGLGGSVGGRSSTAGTGDFGVGVTTVTETNTVDCDGDFDPANPETETADFDGDYESGVGGAFFGFGPWAHEPVCDFALTAHGSVVTVNDVVWGSNVQFVVGADDTNGPDLTPDPVSGEPACTTDGSITPGDPATDPTADADDCLSQVYTGTGATCGAGGDGGYWVFLSGLFVSEGGLGLAPNVNVDDEFTALLHEVGGLNLFCPPCPPGTNCCTTSCLGGLFCCTVACPPGSIPDCQCSIAGAQCKCVGMSTHVGNPPTSGTATA